MAFYIKDIKIEKKVILAPMAGITSFSYREFMNKFGCGLTYTEMISDCGLSYHNKKTEDMLYTDGSDRPLAIQLFGGDKETLLKGLERIEELGIQYDILDLNLACPVPKVTKGNGGSSWLLKEDEMYEMVKAIVEKSSKPVSAKIRLGWDEIKVDDYVQLLEKAGVSFIAIHARTKKELYSGKPHFEALKNVRDLIKIPFGISGDIFTVEDALNALKITRADAVLVARGGVGNPNLISNINLALEGKEYNENVDFDEQTNYLKEFSSLLIKEKGKERAYSLLRGIAPKFYSNFKTSKIKEFRNDITTNAKSIEDMFKIIENYKQTYIN